MPKVKMMAGIDAAISLPNATGKRKKGGKKAILLAYVRKKQ